MSVCCGLRICGVQPAAVLPGRHALRPAKAPGKVRTVGKAQSPGGLAGGAASGQQFPGPLHLHGGKGFHGAPVHSGAEGLLQPGAADPAVLTDLGNGQLPGNVFGKIDPHMIHQRLLIPLLTGTGAQAAGTSAGPHQLDEQKFQIVAEILFCPKGRLGLALRLAHGFRTRRIGAPFGPGPRIEASGARLKAVGKIEGEEIEAGGDAGAAQ